MKRVLDAPMASVERQQLLRTDLCAALAADQIDPLDGGLVFGDMKDFTLHASDLGCLKQRQIAVELAAGPDTSGFHPTVRLVQRLMRRGRPPSGGWRCRP